jgi:FAD-NAD(P)-binding
MANRGTVRVAILGVGPRGTSVLERLIANVAAQDDAAPLLEVHLVDPYPPGPGHVWRTDQSRLYLMNTQSFYPTLVPGGELPAPSPTGHSFEQWRQLQRSSPDGALSPDERSELAALDATGFPSRALYGRYLRWTFEQLLGRLPGGITVHHHPTEARQVRPGSTGGYDVTLANGDVLAVERVVLALGHVDSELSREQQRLSDAAALLDLRYWPPAVPNDLDWSLVPAAEPVLVRGMGLNFFDVVGQLTEGRGGRFEPTGGPAGDAFRYLPSGREPLLVAASRRGVPYRAKAELYSYYPRSVRLRFLTRERVAGLAADAGRPGFDHDLWPLLRRDALWAYYSTLAAHQPEHLRDPDFLGQLNTVLASDAVTWAEVVNDLVRNAVAPAGWLDLEGLARPFAGRHFTDPAEVSAAVLDYLQSDARSSAAGERNPLKMAIGALNAGRAVIKEAVADGGLPDESWLGELRGWFEGYVEGLASGPPALRVEQLAALVRAGVVQFVGPDPVFGVDEDRGTFTAASPWVQAPSWRARHLIEAMAPANRLLQTRSPLLRQLIAEGLVRPRTMLAADGAAVPTSGVDVTGPPYRALDRDGSVQEGLYVLGLQLSSVQWGTAIAAQAAAEYPSGYRTLVDADRIARDILNPAAR